MKILYAIQGTGNGHITRSVSVIKELMKRAEVDVLVSGIHNEVQLPIEVKYRYKGLGFIFGKTGGIDYIQTFKQNKIRRLLKEIKDLPIEQYNFVVSDFEPVSVWSANRVGIPCIGLSNQVSVLHPKIKKPWPPISMSRLFIENYARCNYQIGFHFEAIDDDIVTPVIREEIRNGKCSDLGHGLVYLPFYSDEIIYDALKQVSSLPWTVFSKHSKSAYVRGSVRFEPINGERFNESLLSSHLVITAAGFGTTSEALFLGKKMIVVPMKGQFEQKFNAHVLRKFGVSVIKSLQLPNVKDLIMQAMNESKANKLDYPDNAAILSNKLINLYNGPILEGLHSENYRENQPLDYYLNPANFNRENSGTLSY